MSHEQTAIEMIDEVASVLANRNDVEQSWFLTGVAHGLYSNEADPPGEPSYDEHYMAGFNAAHAHATHHHWVP